MQLQIAGYLLISVRFYTSTFFIAGRKKKTLIANQYSKMNRIASMALELLGATDDSINVNLYDFEVSCSLNEVCVP